MSRKGFVEAQECSTACKVIFACPQQGFPGEKGPTGETGDPGSVQFLQGNFIYNLVPEVTLVPTLFFGSCLQLTSPTTLLVLQGGTFLVSAHGTTSSATTNDLEMVVNASVRIKTVSHTINTSFPHVTGTISLVSGDVFSVRWTGTVGFTSSFFSITKLL